MARIENWNPPEISASTCVYTWDVPYAALVHEGAVGLNSNYPARPWTDYATSQTNLTEHFQQTYTQTQSLDLAFEMAATALFDEFHDAIIDPIWDWPTTTYRLNGEIVRPGPRDIFDTGDLYRSQSMEFIA